MLAPNRKSLGPPRDYLIYGRYLVTWDSWNLHMPFYICSYHFIIEKGDVCRIVDLYRTADEQTTANYLFKNISITSRNNLKSSLFVPNGLCFLEERSQRIGSIKKLSNFFNELSEFECTHNEIIVFSSYVMSDQVLKTLQLEKPINNDVKLGNEHHCDNGKKNSSIILPKENARHTPNCENSTEKHIKNEESNPSDRYPSRKRRHSECNNSENAQQKNKNRRKSYNDFAQSTASSTSDNFLAPIIPVSQVESELEKMFAGIIENNIDPSKNTFDKRINLNEVNDSMILNNPHDSSDKDYISNSLHESEHCNIGDKPNDSETSKLNKKKKKRTSIKASSKKKNKIKNGNKKLKGNDNAESAIDSSTSNLNNRSSKVPTVHLKGQKNNPLNINIVNTFREEDEEKNKEKKKGSANLFNYRNKNQSSDLYNSTMSLKYDAQTTDTSWICVFCKRGPHSIILEQQPKNSLNAANSDAYYNKDQKVYSGVLSDLFGPYIINKCSTQECNILNSEKKSSPAHSKKSKNKKKVVNTTSNDNTNSIHHGMRKLAGEEERWEVWIHEQCTVWAPNVYMTGNKLPGLEEAIWDSSNSICNTCGWSGANIRCMHRNCDAITHYTCGITSNWFFNTKEFISSCENHRNS